VDLAHPLEEVSFVSDRASSPATVFLDELVERDARLLLLSRSILSA